MTIVPKGNGPISRAIRELDQRTKGLNPGQVPGALVSTTPRGVLIQPTAGNQPARRQVPASTSVPRWG